MKWWAEQTRPNYQYLEFWTQRRVLSTVFLGAVAFTLGLLYDGWWTGAASGAAVVAICIFLFRRGGYADRELRMRPPD